MACHSIVIVLLCTFAQVVFTSNLDTEFPIRFNGPKNSYFGYTVALLSNSYAHLVIVGAPKANVTRFPSIPEPGAVFRCNTTSSACSIVPLDPDVDENEWFRGGDLSYRENKQNAWMGVSLDTTSEEGGKLLACSHLWKNQIHPKQYLANGMCYVMNSELDPVSSTKYGPLISEKNQVIKNTGDYYYYAGQAGTSAQFVKGAKSIILGAPGIHEWKGSFALYSDGLGGGITKRSLMSKYGILRVPKPMPTVDFGAYFGYAVTSGAFLKDRVYYAIGAPREEYVGKVYIVDITDDGTIVDKVTKEGKTFTEYFGATVCAVDVNNDGLDDLLVGAPFASKYSTNNEGDEGAVYVYINEDLLRLVHRDYIMGSQVPGARFGSAIAAVGDLNMDGYQDVAIGAPYENGVGAVYIYRGSKSGLVVPHVQKITASMADRRAKGFGISVSRGLDMDNNMYPDIAIGAYDSDQAFLFRTRPLISIEGTLYLGNENIDMDRKTCTFQGNAVACFKAEVCVVYHGKFVQPSIDISTYLEADIFKGNDTGTIRAVILKDGSYQAKVWTVLTVTKDKKQCTFYDIHVPLSPRDYLTPVTMRLTYKMLDSNKSKDFCKTCPVVEQDKSTFDIAQKRFKKDCGVDDKCDADLQLHAWLDGYNSSSPMIMGATNEVILEARISNTAEPAYMTRLVIELPDWVQINQKPTKCDIYGYQNNNYICQVANPLTSKRNESIQLRLNMESILLTEKMLTVNISALTDSSEEAKSLHDNNVQIEVPLIYAADMSIRGILESEQVLYDLDEKGKVKEGKVLFKHTYELFNVQSSRVNLVSIQLVIPTLRREEDLTTLMTIHSIDKYSGKSLATFGSCDQEVLVSTGFNANAVSWENITKEDLSAFPKENFLRRRRDVEAMNLMNGSDANSSMPILNENPETKGVHVINCSTAICENVICSIGPFINEFSASITVTLEIEPRAIKSYMGKQETAAITTIAHVAILDPRIDTEYYNVASDTATLTSFLMPRGATPQELPAWVIPVSVVAGLLLLTILVVTLVKLGFFKREQKEDLEKEKMLHRGEIASTDPLVDGHEE